METRPCPLIVADLGTGGWPQDLGRREDTINTRQGQYISSHSSAFSSVYANTLLPYVLMLFKIVVFLPFHISVKFRVILHMCLHGLLS